tara:strand:+ start:19 stop:546 length:528 start_codon:yes stop_codon:yes gene_type:complete
MKKFLPLILLAFPTVSFANITHSIQSVASVSTVAASATSERIGSSISVAGTNVTPKANTVAGQIGSLDLSDNGIANGVPTVDYDTSFNVVNTGDAFSASETYIQADAVPSLLSATVTNGAVPSLPLLGKNTVVAGGDPGSVAITLDSGQGLTVNLSDMGAGTTATLQSTITLGLD